MKFTISTILAAVMATTTSTTTPVVAAASTDNNKPPILSDMLGTAVEVAIECTGVDFSKMPLGAAVAAGHYLEESYQAVHAKVDDTELSGLHFHGAGAKDYASLTKAMMNNNSNNNNNSDHDLQWWYMPSWYGTWGCRMCPDDDDFVWPPPGWRGAVKGEDGKLSTPGILQAWANEFTASLLMSGLQTFKDVKKCSIGVKEVVDTENVGNVNIALHCQGGPDFTRLSVSEVTLAAHALQTTYNDVHSKANAKKNDDSVLDNVVFRPPSRRFYETNSTIDSSSSYWPTFSGDWDCHDCPEDDDIVVINGAGLTAWETALAAELAGSEHKQFASVSSCSIKMTASSKGFLGEYYYEEEPVDVVVPVLAATADCALRGGCAEK